MYIITILCIPISSTFFLKKKIVQYLGWISHYLGWQDIKISKLEESCWCFTILFTGPNRGGGFGIAEIVDVITLNTKEAREYHEPDVVDNNIFFPMNWTFHLSCDRIQTNDCIFNPIQRHTSLELVKRSKYIALTLV